MITDVSKWFNIEKGNCHQWKLQVVLMEITPSAMRKVDLVKNEWDYLRSELHIYIYEKYVIFNNSPHLLAKLRFVEHFRLRNSSRLLPEPVSETVHHEILNKFFINK